MDGLDRQEIDDGTLLVLVITRFNGTTHDADSLDKLNFERPVSAVDIRAGPIAGLGRSQSWADRRAGPVSELGVDQNKPGIKR